MNKCFTVLALMLCINSPLAMAKEAPVKDPIVNVNKTVKFGIWRVYNEGSYIYFTDKEDKHYLKVEFTTNDPTFSGPDGRLLLHDTGTAGQQGFLDDTHPYAISAAKALEIEPSGHLQVGRYGFGDKRFLVTENSITVFNAGNEDNSGNIFPSTVLKKYSNGVVREGTYTSTIVEATKVLDKNNIAGPAVILGDCLATYSATTGLVTIPCLSVESDNTVFRVTQQQIPNTLTFEVGKDSVTRVQ